MSATDKLIEELLTGLEGVTPGPWTWGMKYVCRREDSKYTRLFGTPNDEQALEGSQWETDAAHIARCSPDNIRALLDTITSLKEENERLRAALAFADGETAKVETLLEPHMSWNDAFTMRVCPMRDATCPHGMSCPYVDGYNCKPGWRTPRPSLTEEEQS